MVRPLITIVMLCLTAVVGIRADAGGGGDFKPGQVKLSPPIPVTLDNGATDIFDYVEFFSHPTAPGWSNFNPNLKNLVLPDATTIEVDDLALLHSASPGECKEAIVTYRPFMRAAQEAHRSFATMAINPIIPAKPVQIPLACEKYLKETSALVKNPAQIPASTAPWCEVYHAAEIAQDADALKEVCPLISAMKSNFNLSLPSTEACAEYLQCVASPQGLPPGYNALDNACPAFKAKCLAKGIIGPLELASTCAKKISQEDVVGFCNTLSVPTLAQCLAGGPLTPAQVDTCSTLLLMRAQGELCIAQGVNNDPNACQGWLIDFRNYCYKENTLWKQMAILSDDLIPLECNALAAVGQQLAKTVFPFDCAAPEAELCAGLDSVDCSKRKALCILKASQPGQAQVLLPRLLVGDVRAPGNAPAINAITEAQFNATAVLPYAATPASASYPASIYPMPAGAVIGGEDWFAGIVAIMRDPRPFVGTSSIGGAGSGIPESETNDTTEHYNVFGWPAVAYFPYSNGATPPLQLAAVNSSFFGPKTTGSWQGMCPLPPKFTIKELPQLKVYLKEKGCLGEQGPVGIAAVNLFSSNNAQSHSRDLVVINQGPVPYGTKDTPDEPETPPVAYITVYQKKQTEPLYPTDVGHDFHKVWTYAGFERLHGLKPREYCVADDDLYIAINESRTLKDKTVYFVIDRVHFNGVEVVVEPIYIRNTPNLYSEFGPSGLACGDFNHDNRTDLAVTWGRYDPDYHSLKADHYNYATVHFGITKGKFQADGMTAWALDVPGAKKSNFMQELMSVDACDLNRDGVDDLCVGDQSLYVMGKEKHAYVHYFPFVKSGLGLLEEGGAQLFRVNTHAKFDPGDGRGGVSYVTSDRFGNLAAVVKSHEYYPPIMQIFCQDRDADGIPDMGGSVIINGTPTSYGNIPEGEIKAKVDEICEHDNCPGVAPKWFVPQKACDGSEVPQVFDKNGNPISYNPCFNPSQKDWDTDGYGDVCDPDVQPKFNFKQEPQFEKDILPVPNMKKETELPKKWQGEP